MKNLKSQSISPIKASAACEAYLNRQKEHNLSYGIQSSENIIINRLLSRSVELSGFYEEIFEKLVIDQWQRVISVVLYTAAFWNPEVAQETRNAKHELESLNNDIAKCALQLEKLLNNRTELSEKYGLHSYDKYHVIDLIDDAARGNGHYQSYLKSQLQNLAGEYDLKYWPSVAEFIEAIGSDAESSEVYATDSVTQELIQSDRNSLTDYFRALFQALDEERQSVHQFIPDDFKLSDESLASMANCALNLTPDNMIDAQYVKRCRQRLREQTSKSIDLVN